jgi:hypothetical protein
MLASATPIKPRIDEVLKQAAQPRRDYPIARVGWEEPKDLAALRNPIYEQMRYPYSREALLGQFVAYSIPDWRLLALFGLLIFTLRYYRYRAKPAPAPGMVAVISQHRPEPLDKAA